MSGLIGSCCEEQEAQEAAAHAKYRKAVRASESRLLARSNLAARLQRSLDDLTRRRDEALCEGARLRAEVERLKTRGDKYAQLKAAHARP